MSDGAAVLEDLRAEGEELDRLVGAAAPSAWVRETPAPGWTLAHQIAHLAWTDERSLLAVRDEARFATEVEAAMAAPDTFVDDGAREGAKKEPEALLAHWRTVRTALAEELAAQPEGRRVPWYGPPMSIPGMATARLMETWAHGGDIADALGVVREPTARLRHIVRLGVRTRDFAYAVHGLTPPGEPFRVEMTAPDGDRWTYGPEDAAQRVTGSALDFCLLVTQRVHRDDTALRAEGPDADAWLGIAQAFAGPPGGGRKCKGASA
ncbi:TIGR03084 family metal-binding protein [Streptomyces sp. ODS28]|uniref:TIGR03084 family metal-binding protein n=1 Tax=Streptomyces sp. ODS28 TaxID=3136688 RepID=UPI0031E97AA2